MAKISVGRTASGYRVMLEGRFSAADLKRLERACRYAFEHKFLPLDLDLGRVTSIDDAARFYLERLRSRGACIQNEPRASSQPAMRGPETP
jgi:hypothetical protein